MKSACLSRTTQHTNMKLNSALSSLLILLCLTMHSTDAITYTKTLGMGQSIGTSDTLVSANGNFELGFFKKNTTYGWIWYVGIWFKKVPKDNIVWVADTDSSYYLVPDSYSILTIGEDGNLIVDIKGRVSLVTNFSNIGSTHALLSDLGNLLLVNNSNLNILWQSFDHPTDTLLPEMKIGVDPDSGRSWSLRSWTSAEDPSPGYFTLELDQYDRKLNIKGMSGTNSIATELFSFTIQGFSPTMTAMWQGGYTSRLVLSASGELSQQIWSEDNKQWVSLQSSKCRLCGDFGICTPQANEPCECLKGFEPDAENSWKEGSMSAGCVRKTPLLCSNTSNNGLANGYFALDRVNYPSTASLVFAAQKASTCESSCSTNCSCVAYAYEFRGRCLLWLDQLMNLINVSFEVREDDMDDDHNRTSIFIKLAASELHDSEPNNKFNHRWKILLIIVVVILFVALLALFAYYYKRRKPRGKGEDLLLFDVGMSMQVRSSELNGVAKVAKINKREVRLPLFNFASVSAATSNFSAANKLGEGGFGPVYKGKLFNGDEVAVKRLSTRSGQGWEEFKNEASLIAKLQHNNLVRLLGCCIDRDEKMLIYEFMPNKSLDFFLFDAARSRILDWGSRVRIIDGIAQGLLYLHQYSRFRIIHRDLKASNILLDINMNPKISDFGLARIFGGNKLQANTNRIVGTYGYMSPEYALEGIFSVKSDVFSFGVIFLEIISGRKNTGFYDTDSLHLLGHAWDLWTSSRGIELMDSAIEDASINKMVVLRYVNIALLCVQENAEDRPTMADVVSMLGNDSTILPYPKPIAFLNVRGIKHPRSYGISAQNASINAMTTSIMEAR